MSHESTSRRHESFPFLSSPFMHFGSTSCEDIRLPKCPTEGWMKGEERRFVIQTIKETRRLVFEEHDWLKTNRLTSPLTSKKSWSGSRICFFFFTFPSQPKVEYHEWRKGDQPKGWRRRNRNQTDRRSKGKASRRPAVGWIEDSSFFFFLLSTPTKGWKKKKDNPQRPSFVQDESKKKQERWRWWVEDESKKKKRPNDRHAIPELISVRMHIVGTDVLSSSSSTKASWRLGDLRSIRYLTPSRRLRLPRTDSQDDSSELLWIFVGLFLTFIGYHTKKSVEDHQQKSSPSDTTPGWIIQCPGWLLPSRHKRLTPWDQPKVGLILVSWSKM